MRYRLQRHDGTDCSATMVPITVLRMVPIQRYRHKHEADGKPVIVTGREVLLFYGEHYGIRPEELKQYATEYCCHIKHYREYGYPLLDRSLMKKMLEEEERITKGKHGHSLCGYTFLGM